MRIDTVPGDYSFKALYTYGVGWQVTDIYFFTREEVEYYFRDLKVHQWKWPIEYQHDGEVVYVPSEEEFK